MAVPVEEGVLSALRGVVSETTRLPKPLLIKVYVASLKDEFKEERRMILEMIGPELQALYDDRQVEIELVDMHFGTGPNRISMVELDPSIMQDYLYEIGRCYKDSKSIFFITLIGENIGKPILPYSIDTDIFEAISGKCSASGHDLLKKWYKPTASEAGHAGDRKFTLCNAYSYAKNQSIEERLQDYRKILDLIEGCCDELMKMPSSEQSFVERIKAIWRTQLEMEIETALDLAPDRMVVVFREWSNQFATPSISPASRDKIRQLKDRLTLSLPAENYTTLIVPGKSSIHTIDSDSEDHEIYLSKFKNKLLSKMSNSIEQSLTNDPDVIKGRKKTVQEIFHEHSTHLRLLNEHLNAHSLLSSSVPDRLRANVLLHFRSGSRHSPYFIQGGHGTGKSALIAELCSNANKWFEYSKVHRVIRFASATPRSAYNLELLRVICQQISIIFNIPEGYLPKDASFDPLYINNWFQNLLRRCEDLNNEVLFLFIDDLHKLNSLDCDNVAALSWLPISLPWNVFIICSTTIPIDQLKFSPIQKDRFKSTEFLFDLSRDVNKTEVRTRDGKGLPFEDVIRREFDCMEDKFGSKGFGRMAAYITCSEYGLTETELLELLMPTESSDAMIETTEGNFNFSTFRKIRNEMELLIREKIMSGKILIEWRHGLCAEIAKSRYIDANSARMMHTEIANIFFNQLADESDETSTDESISEDSQRPKEEKPSPKAQDDTSTLFNPPGADVSYSIRHVEESWHHLMRSDDTGKFKQIAVCNFDFLLASVQTVSISYLRCLIEHVRCYILDRDIELIYYTIRKSSDVLTRDPMQLGAQLISWLRPINEHDENDNSLLSITVRSATAWCDGYTVPLLVPMTGWLPVPLPSQIRTMTVSGTGPIREIVVAPSKQHLVIATKVGDAQLWHIMSNSLVYTFKGHTAPVTCMVVPPGSNLLVTGSEDMSIIVWNTDSRTMKAHIREHNAAVLCVTCAMNNTLAISGGEDSRIVIMDLNTGKVLSRIDHHRGPVSSLQVSAASDVLVSASHDATICLWSLEDYTILNCMQMHSPVLCMRISCDSVFLLAHCADNGLYLRTLATGTELHALKGHKSKVRTMAIAMDSQRAIIGCDDTRALIFDMHSGRLVRSLPPNPGPVTALYVIENDDFLITVGGNKITFYSFRNEEVFVNPYCHRRRKKHSKSILSQRSMNPANIPHVTCFDISRDSQLAAVASSKSVHIMQINSPELQCTLDGHTGAVTCVNFSPNCEFLTSGSEDKTVIVWNLGLGLASTTFKGHSSAVTCVVVLMDSRRIISSDKEGTLHVWLGVSATMLQTIQGPHKFLSATNNMKFAVCTNGDNSLKIWSLTREDEKYTVSHSGEITCFGITADSLYVITGSRDMSLKVWQATGGKLAQVLVGHSDAVTCVAVSVTNKSQVISGSKDCNLIVWDIHTGEEIHTLAGHLAQVTCVKVSADGTTAVSGSDDKTLIVWETKRGLALTSLQIHMPFIRFDISLECSRILVQLADNFNLPVICLHNTPASYVKLPTYSAPALDAEDLRPAGPKRQMKRLLKKEVSLDTYTWQKKYGHLTSSVMMAQVDERLKRRFSVSASMEEISKIAEMKTLQSQASLGPEQAALAQSQHFDQLEALWNKRSPPRRRHNTSLSRQSSLVEDRIESSDEDEFQEERTGMLSNSNNLSPSNTGIHTRPHSLPIAAWNSSFDITRHDPNVQPDLVKDVLAPNILTKTKRANDTIAKSSRWYRYGIRASKIKTIKSDNDLVNVQRRNVHEGRSDGDSGSTGEHCDQRSSSGSAKTDQLHHRHSNNNNSSGNHNDSQLCRRCKKKRSLFSRSCIAQ